MENGKVLVSHAYNCHKLNKTLYLTFADKLYLINEFGNDDDKVIKKLKSENKFLSTETPLYHPNREMIYQCAKISPLTDNDIKHLYTIMPNALQQSKRLKLNSNGYDINLLAAELYQYWKALIKSMDIQHYICGKIPHQLSDYILYEVATRMCKNTRWIYPFSGELDLYYEGSFGKNINLIKNKKRAQGTEDKLTNAINKYISKVKTKSINDEYETYKDVDHWIQEETTKDFINNVAGITWKEYMKMFFDENAITLYTEVLKNAISESTQNKPEKHSHIFLMSVEPEAVLFPLSAPLMGNLQSLSIIRANIPLEKTIYIKDHPLSFMPNHRTHENSKEKIGCMIHRSRQFFKKLKDIPNVKYLAPMKNSSWIHKEKYYVYCTSSSFVFESLALGKNVNVMAPLSNSLAKYTDHINMYPQNKPKLNATKDDMLRMDRLTSIPWYPRMTEMDGEAFQSLVDQ